MNFINTQTAFYDLNPAKLTYFSSYLASFLELKKLTLQPAGQMNVFVMLSDLEAMKTIKDRNIINKNITDNLACFLASGLSPINKNVNIFCQSAVMCHTNLSFYLSYISDANQSDLLFCANSLIYKSDFIATDIGQIEKVNLAVNLAEKFNLEYKTDIFKIPQILLNNLNKTSLDKEIDNFFDITLFDTNDMISEKIQNYKLKENAILYDYEKNPNMSRLIDILSVLTKMTKYDIILSFGASGLSSFKNSIIEATINHISPIRSDINKLKSDVSYLMNIIKSGNQKANFTANNTIEKIKIIIGGY